MNLSPFAQQILRDRFLQTGETPEQRFRAVARHLSTAETNDREMWQEKFYTAFEQNLLILNSPILANYGVAGRLAQGSACFVIPVASNGQLQSTREIAQLIQQTGGGIGINLSSLKEAIPFLASYNALSPAVATNSFRESAFMAVLNCDHPDLPEFIALKQNPSYLTNFNLSIGITDRFMEAVIADDFWELSWTDGYGEKQRTHRHKARSLFQQIVGAAHLSGEPGLLFLDRIQEANPIPGRTINCTNPCGEQPLSPWECCVLGHVNLAAHLQTIHGCFVVNYPQLAQTVGLLVRMLDNSITVNEYPLEIIRETHNLTRKIGLGITGLADLLILLSIPYNSAEGITAANRLMAYIQAHALDTSIQLGLDRGSFPLFPQSIYSGRVPAMRNAARTTIAPTGTTSALLGVEGYGCEPIIALSYSRSICNEIKAEFVSSLFEQTAHREGWYSTELIRNVTKSGSAQLSSVPPHWREVFRTSQEISFQAHLKMQAALQKHTDSGISKTINLPAHADKKEVWQAYVNAYQTKVIKGITIYRADSRPDAPYKQGLGCSCGCD